MPKFEPGDRVRFTAQSIRESPAITRCTGEIIEDESIVPYKLGNDWLYVSWENGDYSTERPSFLEKAEDV